MQKPPAFSAIKVAGERAYDLARAGDSVDLAPRPVFVEALVLLRHDGDSSEFEMVCEKGTYVRALARDLAVVLGTCGHVIALHRAAVGGFSDADAVSLTALEAAADRDALLLPVAAGLSGLPEIRLRPDQASAIRHGNPALLTGAGAPIFLEAAWASCSGEAVALGRVEAGSFLPSRVLLPS
jgi:tRNA pseudouridine55 synthase